MTAGGLRIEEDEDGLRVFFGEEFFCAYDRQNELRPILWPVNGPSGAPVTRAFPQEEGVEGESADHPHHQSVWYGHGRVNGHDFWHCGHGERVVDLREMEIDGPGEEGVLERGFLMSWQVGGEELCQEERVLRFRGTPDERTQDGAGEAYHNGVQEGGPEPGHAHVEVEPAGDRRGCASQPR